MSYDFDLFVIGAGSGGVRAARTAATHGIKVAIAEERFMGGTCVNVGCVPKKLLTYAAKFSQDFEDSVGYGWSKNTHVFDWKALIHNKDKEIARLNRIYTSLLEKSNVTVITGRAHFKNNSTVVVAGKEYTAKRILIACGSTPYIPPIEGAEHVFTSFDAFYLKKFPKRVVVVGSGYIAVEFAGIFSGLGASVVQIVRKGGILSPFDDDVSTFLADQMQKTGVEIVPYSTVTKLEKTQRQFIVHTDKKQVLEADFVLFAVGRVPYTKNLKLAATDVRLKNDGSIVVDEDFQTTAKGVYALGDVLNRSQLTPVALREAMVFVDRIYGDRVKKMRYDTIPTAIFSHPTVATCGLSERQAIARNHPIKIYKSTFLPMKNTLACNPIKCLVKLVVHKNSDRVLGAHMVGDDAAEIMQGLAIAINAGLKKSDFDATIGIHPTIAEEFVTLRE